MGTSFPACLSACLFLSLSWGVNKTACVCTRALVLSGSNKGTLSFHVVCLHGHCGQHCSAFSRRFSQAQCDNIVHIISE